MSRSETSNKVIQIFMKNIFNKEGYFEQNKPFLKNHLRQDIDANNRTFCDEALTFFSERNYIRNQEGLSDKELE